MYIINVLNKEEIYLHVLNQMFFVTPYNVFENKYPLRTIVNSAAVLTFLNGKKTFRKDIKPEM